MLTKGEHHVHLPGSHDHSHDHCHQSDVGDHAHHHGHNDDGGDKKHDKHGDHDHHSHEHEHEHHSHGHDHHETDKLIHSEDNHGCNSYNAVHSDEVPKSHHDEIKKNVNLHAAYIHVLGDLALSVAVLIAGLFIWYNPEWHMIDPICTIFFCIMVFLSTLGVLRTSISVLLEETPPHLKWQEIYDALSSVEVVSNVHDLHIWSISHGEPALSVHCQSSAPTALSEVYKVCQKYGINHATIQIQADGGPCTTCEASCMAQHEGSVDCADGEHHHDDNHHHHHGHYDSQC